MNFVSFSKHIVINFVMLTHTLIIIKLKPLLDLFISMAGLCELIYLVIIAHNLTHISTTFLDAAILGYWPFDFFPKLVDNNPVSI